MDDQPSNATPDEPALPSGSSKLRKVIAVALMAVSLGLVGVMASGAWKLDSAKAKTPAERKWQAEHNGRMKKDALIFMAIPF